MDHPEPEPDAPIILLVEDEFLIRMGMADELRDQGFVVIEAAHPIEAIAAIEAGLHPHVLLTDVRMPGEIDGLALAQRLQTLMPSLLVFIASGHLSATEEAKQIKNFIAKPYDAAQLARRTKTLLEN